MGTPISTDDEMVDFVLGRTKATQFPSPAAWSRILDASVSALITDLKHYGMRELTENEGQAPDRLVARDILKRVDVRRIVRHEWVFGRDMVRVFDDTRYPKELPIRLLDGIVKMVDDRIEQAEVRLERFRFA